MELNFKQVDLKLKLLLNVPKLLSTNEIFSFEMLKYFSYFFKLFNDF